MAVSLAKYVVTFSSLPVVGPGAIEGLRQTGLEYARKTVRMADRIPKHGRIINTETLEEVK